MHPPPLPPPPPTPPPPPEQAATGHHNVHVRLGTDILNVGQVEHGCAVDHTDGDSRHGVDKRHRPFAHKLPFSCPLNGIREGDIRSGNRCGAGTPVGLQHITVDL